MRIKRVLAALATVALALLLPVMLAACGSTEPGLSRSDVEEIVRTQVAAAPAADPGASREEVQQIVDQAISRIPAPSAGPTAAEVERIMRDAIATLSPATPATRETPEASAPPRSAPVEYTQHFVSSAIEYYEENGLQATLDFYNSLESVDGQWYLFIYDEDDVIVAHATIPALVGMSASEIRGPHDYPTSLGIVAVASPDGGWFDYTYLNPASGITEEKHVWAVRHDGLIFASGWYEVGPRKSDQPAYTQAFVEKALNLYDAIGREATIEYYNTQASVDGQWYVFIFDENDVMAAHAANPGLVGLHASDVLGPNSYPLGEAVVAAAGEDGAWFSYTYPNPGSGGVEAKHSWMVRHDGLTFGSGWYEAGPRKSDQPAYTQAFVERALSLYDAIGRKATVEYYKTKESIDGQWYVFIIDGDGYTISHHNPALIGRDPSLRIDSTGYFYGDDLRSATESGRWVSYTFNNPEAGQEGVKHTWAVLHDGLIIASGWYE